MRWSLPQGFEGLVTNLALVVRVAVLQPENGLDGRELSIVPHVPMRCLAHVEQLPLQWEHPVPVSTQNAQAADCQRLRRVALGQNQRTFMPLIGTRQVCVLQLGDQQPLSCTPRVRRPVWAFDAPSVMAPSLRPPLS